MKNSIKAIRRQHKERMKKKARWLYPDYPNAEHFADYLCCCSKPCCGNPRRHFNQLTLQEKIQLEKEKCTT